MATERKQKAISLDVKMKILKEVDEGSKSKSQISKEFGIPASTLSTIIKNREKITTASERNKFEPQRKSFRTAKHVDLESALIIWFNQARAQNAPISGLTLMAKADSLAADLGLEFKSSPGWLERFKLRNGLVFKTVSGQSADVKPDMTSEWKKTILPKLLKDFEPKNIFNADETGLYFRCIPEKTLAYKKEKCSGGKKSKERITAMVACNSDGSEKIPMFVIGKS